MVEEYLDLDMDCIEINNLNECKMETSCATMVIYIKFLLYTPCLVFVHYLG